MAQQQTWQWSTRTTVVSTGSETLLYEVAKRSIDILLATALIIVLLPLLLLIALLIKLDSPGPVIFTQEREAPTVWAPPFLGRPEFHLL